MKKANATHKALFGLTLLFMLIAALSFAAFRETESLCSISAKKSCQAAAPKHSGGQMLWDDFSRHFLSLVSIR